METLPNMNTSLNAAYEIRVGKHGLEHRHGGRWHWVQDTHPSYVHTGEPTEVPFTYGYKFTDLVGAHPEAEQFPAAARTLTWRAYAKRVMSEPGLRRKLFVTLNPGSRGGGEVKAVAVAAGPVTGEY